MDSPSTQNGAFGEQAELAIGAKGPDIAAIDPSSPQRFLNRERSWLQFNKRVLEEAENVRNPVLERLRFLSISASNLDEFFMVRVAGLVGQVREGITQLSQEGLSPSQQLEMVNKAAQELMLEQQQCWQKLGPLMEEQGVHLLSPGALDDQDLKWLEKKFLSEIFPVLTPLAVDPAHPFPFIPNQGFVLCFDLKRKKREEYYSALLPVPQKVPRFMRLPTRETLDNGLPVVRYVALERVIEQFLDKIFPGYKLRAKGAFRILRDSDVELEEEAEDLVRLFENMLQRRRRGDVIRLKIDSHTSDYLQDMVRQSLGVRSRDMVKVDGLLGLSQINEMIPADRPDLQFEPYEPRLPERLSEHGGNSFSAIAAKDILIHHPYESFDVVVQYLQQAARDPDVLAIKQTLYRTSKQSPIVDALIAAAEAGKNVTAVVELKARFDEEANIRLARSLERAGVNVVYGFVDYKTHAKLSLVVRKEGKKTRSYVHIGTGNYHAVTARLYTDLSLFTANEAVARDAAKVFNYVTGYAQPDDLKHLTVAPLTMREDFYRLIDKEIAFAKSGKPASIWAKMNSLVDGGMIDKLYQASQAGVQIDLIVRGICCLRPGVPGLSENIRVKSIVGRFLEHSRIACFGNGKPMPNKEAKVYIGSADWMPRNLNRRVEIMCPILNATVLGQVLDQIMVANLNDEAQSWNMLPDGSYQRQPLPSDPKNAFNVHQYFMTHPSLSGRGAAIEYNAPELLHPSSKRLKRKGKKNNSNKNSNSKNKT